MHVRIAVACTATDFQSHTCMHTPNLAHMPEHKLHCLKLVTLKEAVTQSQALLQNIYFRIFDVVYFRPPCF